jgi:eukaryotic-like serine/threonine-protein kinase
VPIMGTEHRLLGVLVLGEKKSEEPYTAQDRALVKRVGDEVGVVYENLELRGLVRRERQVQIDVLARVASHDFNLMKECPSCGRCHDASAAVCSHDGSELSLSLPVERTIDGRYRLDRLIGKGGMGAVYEATDLRLNRAVAVKVMTGRSFGDTAALRRFSREAQASARLVHPNIVRLFDYGELSAAGAFLVLELVRGVTWRRMLSEKGALVPDFASGLFEQLMAGVEAAHSARIIHRDLKPDNVIIQGAGDALTAKILDFGLAKMRGPDFPDSESMTAPGVTVGTLGYMSPEQYLGASVDERTDIYSIGVMALETLTGKLQLNAHSFHTQIVEVVRRRFDFEGSTAEHRRLAGCISKSVAIQPRERFRDIPDLREEMLPAMRACPPVAGASRVAAAEADHATKTI